MNKITSIFACDIRIAHNTLQLEERKPEEGTKLV